VRLSKGLGLGLMLSRGGLGNELCFYDHRRVSSLGKWGVILASVVFFGLYFCYPIDDGGGYSFVIVASCLSFLLFSHSLPFVLFQEKTSRLEEKA